MHAYDRIAPVEDDVGGHVEVLAGDALGPGREVRRRAHLHRDAHLLQLAAQVLRHVLALYVGTGHVVHRQRQALALAILFETRLFEQLFGLLQVQRILHHVRRGERAGADDGAVRGLGETGIQGLGDEALVGGVSDGLPHPYIVERLARRIESQPAQGAYAFVALAGHGDGRIILGAPQDGGLGHEGQGGDIPALQADQQIGGIGIDLHHDAVQIGLAGQEELVELLQHDLLSRLEFLELERPRSNHVGRVARMVLQVLAVVVDMLGQHWHQGGRQRQQNGWMRFAHAQHHRVGVRRVHRLHWREHGLEWMVLLDRHDGKRHVGRGHWLAVVEHGVLAQVQGQRLAVRRQFPGLRQIRLRLPIVVITQQAGEQLRAGQGGCRARLDRAVQVPWHLRRTYHQRAAGLGRVRGHGSIRQGQRGQYRGQAFLCAAHVLPLDVLSDGLWG